MAGCFCWRGNELLLEVCAYFSYMGQEVCVLDLVDDCDGDCGDEWAAAEGRFRACRGVMAWETCSVQSMAPMGRPPARGLAMVTTSGSMPKCW